MDPEVTREFLEASEYDGCVSVGGLAVRLGLYCECMTWARGPQKLMTRHHPKCPQYDPEGDAAEVIRELLKSMRRWASEEDGVPDFAEPSYEHASFMIDYHGPEEPKTEGG